MLKRLPIPLAKVKASITSEIFLYEIFQIIYSLCGAKFFILGKEINKKVYNDIMNSIKI